MKKLLMVVLSSLMILVIATVAMAAPTTTIKGNLNLFYEARKTNGSEENYYIPGNLGGEYEKWEAEIMSNAEIYIRVNTKFNDNFSTRITAYAEKNGQFTANSYWGRFDYDFATFQFGLFDMGSKGNVTLIQGPYKAFKGVNAIKVTVPLDRGFSGSLGYFLDGMTKDEMIKTGAYVATLSFTKAGKFGGDVNLLRTAEVTGEFHDEYYGDGYTVNVWHQMLDTMRIYVHNGARDVKNAPNIHNPNDAQYWRNTILGVFLNRPAKLPITVRLEYDFDSKNDFCAWNEDGMNQWGFRVQYPISPGINLSYERWDSFTAASPKWPYANNKSPREYKNRIALRCAF